MKKFFNRCVIICLLAVLTGCGSNSGLKYTTDSSKGNGDMGNALADKDNTEIAYITPISEIEELEHGFSAVRFL